MDYSSTLSKIKEKLETSQKKPIDYQERGREFEVLINKICEDEKILLQRSGYTSDNASQQIDGAIEVNGHIFLLEIKWESSNTLAASKYYSFLGKILSKIDGTLGLFISFNDLRENFQNSIRNGIQQKCITICGEDSINDIVSGKVSLREFVLWLYRKASVDNIITKSTSEYLSDSSILIKNGNLQTGDKLSKIVSVLTDVQKDKSALLQVIGPDNTILVNNLEYFINCYINHSTKWLISEKISVIINLAFQEDSPKCIEIIKGIYSNNNWQNYADETLIETLKDLITPQNGLIYDNVIKKIVENARDYLIKNDDNWDQENQASRVISLFYNILPKNEKNSLGEAYYNIYVDSYRKSHFPQKKMATTIFSDRDIDKVKIAETMIKRELKSQKACMALYEDSKKNIIWHVAYRLKADEAGINDETLSRWFDEA